MALGNPRLDGRQGIGRKRRGSAMAGIRLAAVASVAAGLSIGAALTVGATLAAADQRTAPAQRPPAPSSPLQVQYGDRCIHGHCLPCDSVQGCLDKLDDVRR